MPLHAARSAARAPEVGRILVGEDDDDLRKVIAMSLEMAGYSVIEARDGAELLDFLCATAPGHFDLVICDHRMPGPQGIECLSMTRSRAPFVILSGHVDDDMRAAATRFGAARLLEKPIDLTELMGLVDGLVSTGSADDGGEASG
jgi:CheY-like chemotaxis protein